VANGFVRLAHQCLQFFLRPTRILVQFCGDVQQGYIESTLDKWVGGD
jgi:hypothetical protein